MRYGLDELAKETAARVSQTLATDLRNSTEWHAGAYSTEGGAPLAAPGFLSWDTLVGDLLSNLQRRHDPFELRHSHESALKYSQEITVPAQVAVNTYISMLLLEPEVDTSHPRIRVLSLRVFRAMRLRVSRSNCDE